MRCSGEVVLNAPAVSASDHIARIAGTLRERGAVLVRSADCKASFASCTLHLGRNSFVILGRGELAIKSEGQSKVLAFSVEVPLIDNGFFGLIFSAVLAALVLSTGVGFVLSTFAFLLSLYGYLRWARRQAGWWIQSVALESDANAPKAI